ncbi:MAG TPA: cell shape determination protein CcmA [Bacteroidales bacterium]|nr:MAG: cell shape determination protein CcmA [Bacteroidetes bacterium GWF2_33_38]OFY71419.1 MAG: cell shape determination protein CcmA [Bacteroidetes bacterium RIFOXYA12_FULL_33_9]OFY86071.1 MAG: cell shape determination protein CcmA [Bacteroidetes bacterium RIFOXYA2_FULL_33_7]HBF87673.1 cell shape determination protein CcmA [Bacteroidales bacterium]
MGKNNETEVKAINLIGVGTTIVGDIESNGDIRIDGSLNGNLNTKGKLVIGETGKIKGEIICKNADISGVVEGRITISELLTLKLTAKIFGDIITNRLTVEPGAVFTGTCNMSANSASLNGDQKNQQAKPAFEKSIK